MPLHRQFPPPTLTLSPRWVERGRSKWAFIDVEKYSFIGFRRRSEIQHRRPVVQVDNTAGIRYGSLREHRTKNRRRQFSCRSHFFPRRSVSIPRHYRACRTAPRDLLGNYRPERIPDYGRRTVCPLVANREACRGGPTNQMDQFVENFGPQGSQMAKSPFHRFHTKTVSASRLDKHVPIARRLATQPSAQSASITNRRIPMPGSTRPERPADRND